MSTTRQPYRADVPMLAICWLDLGARLFVAVSWICAFAAMAISIMLKLKAPAPDRTLNR